MARTKDTDGWAVANWKDMYWVNPYILMNIPRGPTVIINTAHTYTNVNDFKRIPYLQYKFVQVVPYLDKRKVINEYKKKHNIAAFGNTVAGQINTLQHIKERIYECDFVKERYVIESFIQKSLDANPKHNLDVQFDKTGPKSGNTSQKDEPTWIATKKKIKITDKNGNKVERTLFKNASNPQDLRIRKLQSGHWVYVTV